MPRQKTAKTALAEAYERELKKLNTTEETVENESDTTEELDFDCDQYNNIQTIEEGIWD